LAEAYAEKMLNHSARSNTFFTFKEKMLKLFKRKELRNWNFSGY